MAIGAKKNETRGRLTHFRGDLAICSAKKKIKPADLPLEVHAWMRKNLEGGEDIKKILDDLPYGKVLCVVRVFDCREGFVVWSNGLSENEQALGYYVDVHNYPCDRWAWMTDNLRKLAEPVDVSGFQGFFELPADVEAKVRAQL